MPVCVGARAAGGRAQSALSQVPCAGGWGGGGRRITPWVGAWPSCSTHSWSWGVLGGGGDSRQGHTFVVFQRAVVGACGGLCVPGAPGPSSGAWVPYHEAAEGVCGSGDRQLPPAHD